MKLRAFVLHQPYKGPPTPAAVHEWSAVLADQFFAVQQKTVWVDEVITFLKRENAPIGKGNSKEEALENLTRIIKDIRGQLDKAGVVALEMTEIDV